MACCLCAKKRTKTLSNPRPYIPLCAHNNYMYIRNIWNVILLWIRHDVGPTLSVAMPVFPSFNIFIVERKKKNDYNGHLSDTLQLTNMQRVSCSDLQLLHLLPIERKHRTATPSSIRHHPIRVPSHC